LITQRSLDKSLTGGETSINDRFTQSVLHNITQGLRGFVDFLQGGV
jgi:hypothetical protein